MTETLASPSIRLSSSRLLAVHGAMAATVLVAERIGIVTVPFAGTGIVLFPLLWALLIATGLSLSGTQFWRRGAYPLQSFAGHCVQASVLLLVAKLGWIVGDSIVVIAAAGWALAFQELGHMIGTMALALPMALLLGIKREAVGATFSIGREFSLAVIAERYGIGSAEGRGVLAEYVTGTVFGALAIALIAGLFANSGLLDPRALAMGAGIGSGSMMAAAVGAISAAAPTEAKEVAALAAASNLLTTTVGAYVTLFVSLPLVEWLYHRLEPVLAPRRARAIQPDLAPPAETASASFAADAATVLISGGTAVIVSAAVTGSSILTMLPGMAIVVVTALAGMLLHRALPRLRIPLVCWVSVLGILCAVPGLPIAASLGPAVSKVWFLTLVTPVLAYAGLSLAKDLPMLRRLGWRIVVVSLLANVGTFVFGALIAQLFLPNR